MFKGRYLVALCALALAAALAAPPLSFAADGADAASQPAADTPAAAEPAAADTPAAAEPAAQPGLVAAEPAASAEPAVPAEPAAAEPVAAAEPAAAAEEPAPVKRTGKTKRVANGVYYLKSASKAKVALGDPKASARKGVQMRGMAAASSDAQKFYVRNEGNGLVSLQVVASGLFLGERDGKVVQLKDSSRDAMRWRFVSDHGLKLENASSGDVLTLAGGKVAKGARAVTARDAAGKSQRWKLTAAKLVTGGYYRIKSATGNYLDVGDASCRYGANIQTWSSNWSGAQSFHLYEKSGGYFYIENSKSFLVVDVSGASTANRANVVQSKKTADAGSLWKPVLDRSGKLVFKNKKSGKVLEVADSSKKRGANVRQNKRTGAKGQLWTLERTARYSLSGDGALDHRVANVLRSVTSLREAFTWTVRHPYREGQRYYSNPRVLPDSRTIALANDFLLHGSGNCYRFAATFSWLARGLGYNTRVISGWVQGAGGGAAPHGWVEVVSGGRTYVCDPDLQHEMPSYGWFMTTYATSPTAYHSW